MKFKCKNVRSILEICMEMTVKSEIETNALNVCVQWEDNEIKVTNAMRMLQNHELEI